MNGIVDVGGGLRGIYGAGVFDRCLDEDICFDYCMGVSAGAANIASYTAKQKGRNYRYYHDYSLRREYMSFGTLLRTGSFLGLDYIYGTLSNADGEDPLDFERMAAYPGIVKTVATDVFTGEPIYFTKDDYRQDAYDVLKASCCLPIVCRPYVLDGTPYLDGGVSDPVPVEKAFADGCDRVVVVLTKPLDADASVLRNAVASKLLRWKYPKASATIAKTSERYLAGVAAIQEYQRAGRVLIVAPDDCCGMKTLTKDGDKIDRLYRKGYEDAGRIRAFLE